MEYAIEVAHSVTILHMGRNFRPELAQPIPRDVAVPLFQQLVTAGEELQRLWQRSRAEEARAKELAGIKDELQPLAS